jgi:hypothetical protein
MHAVALAASLLWLLVGDMRDKLTGRGPHLGDAEARDEADVPPLIRLD